VTWITLVVLIFIARWIGPIGGPSWRATISVTLQCAALAAAGWVAGRLSRPDSVIAAVVFAATLSLWDFGDLLEINLRWMLRLTADAIRDPVYRDAWAATLGTHVVLYGCLIGGGLLGRPRRHPQSLGIGA
jgi:hypothetical protein